MDEADDLPVLPPSPAPSLPPSLPPSVPAVPPPSPVASPTHADTDETDTSDRTLADRLATRHVPKTTPHHVDFGLPTAPITTDPRTEFVRPDLVSMSDPTVALLVGRVLIAVAALLIGIVARRATGGGSRADAFWPVVLSAGVFTAVGLAGLVFWSALLAENARRLKARCVTARGMTWSWLIVVGWVVLSCGTYLRIEVEGDLDPLPGVAAVGWAIVLAIAYGRLQGVFRGLSRTPPIVWFTAFPLDLLAIGLVWWRLTSWPSPVGGEIDHVRLTSNVAFGAAAALALNALVFGWLAQKGSNGVYERLGRLEAQRRHGDGPGPEWFQAGLAARQAQAQSLARTGAPVVQRPLIPTRHLATSVSILHVVWGIGLVVFGILLALLAFEYADVPVFLGDELALAAADTDRVTFVATIVAIVYVAAIITHGVWAVLVAINARRITVHSPNPGTFAVAFVPMPLLAVTGLLVGGRLGYWLVVAGLTLAFFALVLVNQMLMSLSGRLGGQLTGFSRWTLCLAVTYLAGVALNFMFSRAAAQLGLYATLSFVQGVLIGVGGVIGFRAMRALEDTLRNHRQTERSDIG